MRTRQGDQRRPMLRLASAALGLGWASSLMAQSPDFTQPVVLPALVVQASGRVQEPPTARPSEPPRLPESVPGVPLEPRAPAQPPPAPPEPRRLPELGVPLGATPKPSKQTLETFDKFVGGIVDPENTLDVVIGRPRLLQLKQTPKKAQVGDESIAEGGFITDRDYSVLGKSVGSTVLNLFFDDPATPGKLKVISYLIRVLPDTKARERLERVYKALEEEINRAFPDSHICLSLVGDKIAVAGQCKDIAEATQILRIVRANAPTDRNEAARVPVDSINVQVNANEIDPSLTPGLKDFLLAGGPNVINLIRIPGEQQVMLKVTVAEVNRNAARSIGLNFSLTNSQGTTYFQQLTGGIGIGGGVNNLPVIISNGQAVAAINALRTLNFARTLAEPSLTTLNGRTANFQAGGQFPVPVVTGFTNAGLQGVSFVPFGVQLSFTPTITDKDRIRLTINADVSERIAGEQTNINGANVPNLQTRNFSTTVELRAGQTFGVAGLIQTNYGARAQRVPYFGDLPFLGRAFAFDQSTAGEQELVILVTPQLVHPLEAKEVPPLPGSDLFEPGDIEFYLRGILESRRAYDYRSPARTDIDRMRSYRRCEETFIVGPHGSSEPK